MVVSQDIKARLGCCMQERHDSFLAGSNPNLDEGKNKASKEMITLYSPVPLSCLIFIVFLEPLPLKTEKTKPVLQTELSTKNT